MTNPVFIGLLFLFAFFSGSVPFGFIAGRRKGIDLREHGSKNIGATNTLRVLGKTAGITVLLLDAAKGLIPVLLAQYAFRLPPIYQVGVGLAAVLGHIYSPFVRFKGGKGVATTLGVLIGLNPVIAALSFGVFFATVWLTKYVSLGSLLGAVTQAVLFWVLHKPGEDYALPAFGTLVAIFVIARHRANIGRLLAGTESKWGEKKGDDAGASPGDAPSS